MNASPDTRVQIYTGSDSPPPQAIDLLGHEVQDRFAAAGAGGAAAQPVCLAVVRDGEWLAATLMLLESPDGEEKVASIDQLVVPAANRGRGLAGRLVRAAMNYAAEQQCCRIRSTAGWGCPDHLHFYQRMRFEQAPPGDRPYLVTRPLERSRSG